MRTCVNGVHTSGSQYPRTEPCEVNPDSSNTAWNPSDGRTRIFHGIYKVNHLPAGDREATLFQVHNGNTEVTTVRISDTGKAMQVVVRKNGHPLPPALDAAYTYGRSFDVQVVVNRRVLVYFNGTKRFDYPFTDLSGTGRSIYLKAGDYLQANTSTASASDYGDVELRLPTGASHFLTRSNAAPSAPVVGPPPAPPSSSPSTASTDPSPNGPPGNWGLAWRDDFNGDHLDTSRWHAHNGWKTNNVTTSSSPANVAVSGGQLTLTLTSPDTGAEIASAPYTGAGPNGYTLEVGDYVEASVRFPGDGKNLYNWPAWWASGPNYPTNGEHDIAEVLEGGKLTVNYHSSSGAHNQGEGMPGHYMGDAFHTYGVLRAADHAEVYWDGKLVTSYKTDDHGGGQSLLLNIGRSGSGPLKLGPGGALRVDYVRAFRPTRA